jgi:DNA-binding CsgD family transcriptional regulator
MSNSPARRWLVCVASPANEQAMQSSRLGLLGLIMDELGAPARRALGSNRLPRASWISQRERDVLEYLVLGHSVREIAEALSRSPHTIHDHVKSLHRKLNAQSRGELVARALGHANAEATSGEVAAPNSGVHVNGTAQVEAKSPVTFDQRPTL